MTPQGDVRLAVRVGCSRQRASVVPEEWPSRIACRKAGGALQNPAYRPADGFTNEGSGATRRTPRHLEAVIAGCIRDPDSSRLRLRGFRSRPRRQPRCAGAGDDEANLKIMMHTAAIFVLLVGAHAGGFVTGLAGFGTGLMALGIWLYVLPPSIAVPLVLICSIVAQSSTLPAFRRHIDFKLVWPFLIGGLAGVPLGTMLVADADPRIFKLSVGALLLVFPAALYFNRKPLAWSFGGRAADAAIGFAGGILGGLAGLSGPIPTLWASVRGWGKHERRGVFQIYNWTVLTLALCLQVGAGLITSEVVWLALFALPATIFGAWLGARAYHVLSDRNFRDVVLGLLFLSGLGL